MKHNFFFSGNAAVSEACSAFVKNVFDTKERLQLFKVTRKSNFSLPVFIIISIFHNDLCIICHFNLNLQRFQYGPV